MEELKKCSRCDLELPVTQYNVVRRDGKSWAYTYCKKCHKVQKDDWLARNYERNLKYRREWARKNRKRVPEKELLNDLRRACKSMGVTVEWYKDRLEKQSSVCALCLKPETSWSKPGGRIRRLAIDHCHKDGTARGLLCSACNQAVGKIEGSDGWIERAIEYLKKD